MNPKSGSRLFLAMLAVLVCLILPFRLAAQASAARPIGKTKTPSPLIEQPKTSSLLAGLSGIVDWVQAITPTLRNQGNQADRDKLSAKLKLINDQLSNTETQNLNIVTNLRSGTPEYSLLEAQLRDLQGSLKSIAQTIGDIRSDLHIQGQTEFERHASDAVNAKGIEVGKMLAKLQYSAPHDAQEREALQAQSQDLVTLIRKAEDAIAGARSALHSPVKAHGE